jgi:hypothetical protein
MTPHPARGVYSEPLRFAQGGSNRRRNRLRAVRIGRANGLATLEGEGNRYRNPALSQGALGRGWSCVAGPSEGSLASNAVRKLDLKFEFRTSAY